MDAIKSPEQVFAEERDFPNLLAGWAPDELRHAAQINMAIAKVSNDYVNACREAMASIVAIDFSIPEDFHSFFGGAQAQNRAWSTHLDSVSRDNDAATQEAVRAAGALLWLAEQRESGAS
ncbi:hypothetical protein [Mycobacteroides abscessus]|uniref:hypothetical protein n=1 Tax=Mycobacteroides abscessus TaxID=36809 RepID=UPI000929BB63|nr:hypothetical protein [Mycobacteroides abscessus]SIF35711.1 Uncharacterised protein [Mycobacteroides abscessus subsp. abscessus]